MGMIFNKPLKPKTIAKMKRMSNETIHYTDTIFISKLKNRLVLATISCALAIAIRFIDRDPLQIWLLYV